MRRLYRNLVTRARAILPTLDAARSFLVDALHAPAPTRGARLNLYVTGDPVGLAERRIFGVAPEGWRVDDGGHYLDGTNPIWRFVEVDGAGRHVEVHRAASWFGEGAYTTADVHDAFSWLDRNVPALIDPGAVLLATPSTTARDWMLRLCPEGDYWPAMPTELRSIVRELAPQARIETVPEPPALDGGGLDQLWEYDGRFMYAALCRELPCGIPDARLPLDDAGVPDWYAPAKVEVEYTVPDDAPIGPFHVWDDDAGPGGTGAWTWPRGPWWHRAWVDMAELHAANRVGLVDKVTFRSGFVWRQRGNPLDLWARKIIRARDVAPSAMTRAAFRMALVQGIGAIHGAPHRVSRSGDLDTPFPAGATNRRVEGGVKAWTELREPVWEDMAHPEWSTAIWGRARARLLSNPQGSITDVYPGHVVAFRTDAIYTTGPLPWADDGKVGRYRLVRAGTTSAPWPRNATDLLRIRADLGEQRPGFDLDGEGGAGGDQ